jgi:hypothetical protein
MKSMAERTVSYAEILKARRMENSLSAKPQAPAAHADDAGWPEESLDAEARFGQPQARLYPFIGKRVWTARGAGVLLQVFADKCEIHQDGADRTVRVPFGEVKLIQ